MTRLLALCSTYNRKETTLNCLRSLYIAARTDEIELSIVLVDDGSEDGTVEAVGKEFEDILILRSSNLYWAGAMRFGFHSIDGHYDYDYLLAFNDDVIFLPDFLLQFKLQLQENRVSEVIVGETLDSLCSSITYGARVRRYRLYPLSFRLIHPSENDSEIDTFNMNALFVSKKILDEYGFLHNGFIHSGADFDYGLMLSRSNVGISRLKVPVGICDVNESGFNNAFGLSISRVKEELSIKRQPLTQRILFCRRNGGSIWWAWILLPYLKAFLYGKTK